MIIYKRLKYNRVNKKKGGFGYGEIANLINAAGVSPSQAPIESILKVDLYGTAVLLEKVGKVIKKGGVGGATASY